MKVQELKKKLKALSTEELMQEKITLMRKKMGLLVLKKNQELQKTHELRIIRRQIAQINTLIGGSTS